ncbi:alpha/beta hydrolase [Variovorax saccharolyticus]|uniref:alpha/beta hydrolase n=1 Tax=Variovorax saccharolyticus TaxID=3053516 RepID=UPI002574A129|nr:alpha/beta hydrolase [Variovorax sp. J31P216]MDM0027021.1 alpha/beta hydrolase [Variovorax sp. J31P216]
MLHPQAQAFIDLLVQRGIPPTHTLTPADARKFYRERRAVTQPDPGEVAEVRELQADGAPGPIPLRLYRPLGAAASAVLPVLVYYHGGGWTIGDLDTHDTLCRELCNGSGCAVVAVDYRMGPEHRFPAAVDDALAATRWVRREAAALGVDPGRLAVGGDSAGGNLAAVVAIAARDAGDLPIAYQLLIYPATDMRRVHPSHVSNGQGYVLTADTIRYFHDQYITDPAHDSDWRASPLLREDLAGLPPALVLTAGYDPLRDEGLDYARALTAAGNRASYVCFERQIHGFITMGRLLDEAGSAVSLCAAELRRALRP